MNKSIYSKNREARTYLRLSMEALWLATVFLVPVIVAPSDWMLTYVQLPKLAMLRILVGLMAMLWVLDWVLGSNRWGVPRFPNGFSGLRDWMSADPARPLLVAVSAFVAINVISATFSPSAAASFWGRSPNEDGYSVYNVVSYFLLFLVISTRMDSRPQLWRLVGAIVAGGVVTSLAGVAQFYELGFFSPGLGRRVDATFGNPIFFAAYLLMTISMSLALYLAIGEHIIRRVSFFIFVAIIGTQLLAFILTLSRGPWIGFVFGMTVFFIVALMALERRVALKAMAVLLVSLGISLIVLVTVDSGDAGKANSTVQSVENRIISIFPKGTSTGLDSRIEIWKVTADHILQRPWFPFEELSLSFARHLIGYGPETYRYVFPIDVSASKLANTGVPSFAHNHIIHEALELGFLGALSYIAIWGAFFGTVIILIIRRRKEYEADHMIMLVALFGVLSGRAIEQMVGIAHVGDLTIFWVLLATFAALPRVMEMTSAGRFKERKRSRVTVTQTQLWRMGIAAIAVVILGSLIWFKNVNYIRADVSVASGIELAFTDPVQALSLMDRAVDLASDVPEYYHARARILKSIQDSVTEIEAKLELAERAYVDNLTGVEMRPYDVGAQFQLAKSTLDLAELGYGGKGEEAIDRYAHVVEMAPGFIDARIFLAIANIENGQFQRSLSIIDELISMNPGSNNFAKTYYLQGVAYNELDLKSEAIESLLLAAGLGVSASLEPEVHLLLANIYAEMGNSERADAHTEKYQDLIAPSES